MNILIPPKPFIFNNLSLLTLSLLIPPSAKNLLLLKIDSKLNLYISKLKSGSFIDLEIFLLNIILICSDNGILIDIERLFNK